MHYPQSSDRAAIRLIGPWIKARIESAEATADPGDIIHYKIYYNNTGENIELAKDLWITSFLDQNTTYSESFPIGTYDSLLHTVSWHSTNVPVNFAGLVHFNVTLRVGIEPRAVILNRIKAQFTDALGNLMPEDQSNTSVVATAPSMTIEQQADKRSLESGEYVRFTLYYNNSGNGIAGLVWINLTLDPNLQYRGDERELGEFFISDNSLSWLFFDVAPGSHKLIIIAQAQTLLNNAMTMVNLPRLDYMDLNRNPIASFSAAQVSLTARAPVFELFIALDRETATPSETVNYTITFRNIGPAAAKSVWINDTFDASLAYQLDDTLLGPQVFGGQYSWYFKDVAPNSTVSFRVTLQVKVGTPIGTLVSNHVTLEHTDSRGTGYVRVKSNVLTLKVSMESVSFFDTVYLPITIAASALAIESVLFVMMRMKPSIEEVFVVHNNGVLLSHLSKTLTPDKDEDILTGMFTAVQDFVRESFKLAGGGQIQSFDLGGYKVAIERGKYAYLAVVFSKRGRVGLQRRMKRAIARIEETYGSVLSLWLGEMEKVAGVKNIIKEELWEKPARNRKTKDVPGRNP